MSDTDDFYYRRKPHTSIVRRQGMVPEVRAASYTYEDHMHARDGTLPDERTPKGMDWHQTALGMRNSRSVNRVVKELLEGGDLYRLNDGRLTSPDVQRELAQRARLRNKPKGGGQSGGGESGSGGAVPAPRQLVLIEGGRGGEPVDRPVDTPVDEPGTVPEQTDVGPNLDRTKGKPRPMSVEKLNDINGPSPHHSRAIANQRVVVVIPFEAARARAGPSAWA